MKEVGAVFAGTILLIGLIIWGAMEMKRYQCRVTWEESGRQSRWGMMTGCQVHDGTGWVPAKNYRSF